MVKSFGELQGSKLRTEFVTAEGLGPNCMCRNLFEPRKFPKNREGQRAHQHFQARRNGRISVSTLRVIDQWCYTQSQGVYPGQRVSSQKPLHPLWHDRRLFRSQLLQEYPLIFYLFVVYGKISFPTHWAFEDRAI